MEIKRLEHKCIEATLARLGLDYRMLAFEKLLDLSNRTSDELGHGKISADTLADYLNNRVSHPNDNRLNHTSQTCGDLPHGWLPSTNL